MSQEYENLFAEIEKRKREKTASEKTASARTASKQGLSREQLAGRLNTTFELTHTTSYIGGWLIYGFSVVSLIVGIGLVGGLWSSQNFPSYEFKNYCYALWAVLTFGVIMATVFVIYFRYNMKDLIAKSKDNIYTVLNVSKPKSVDRK